MLFQQRFLDGIRAGAVTVAFRRWRRPSVRTGGTLLTPIGELGITSVSRIRPDQISSADARRAGYASLEALHAELHRRTEGDIYRIELGPLRPDPRVALRTSQTMTLDERRDVLDRLRRLDARAPDGAWTLRTLEAIVAHAGLRAGDLCRVIGMEQEPLKLNVRKLKSLGLTESLVTGYRLSPRGEAVLRALHSLDTER